MMNQQEINKVLDTMLSNIKSRNFLNHLVRSYFPLSKIEKVFDKPDKEFICVITKKSLVSVNEVLEATQTDEFKEMFLSSIKKSLEPDNKFSPILPEILDNKQLGFTAPNTNTFMSYNGLVGFHNWILGKLLSEDKHIKWLIASINNGGKKLNKNKSNKKNPENPKQYQTTFSFGDIKGFEELKNKINKDEVRN